MERIIADGKRFVDSKGRERIFNGINLVNKGTHDICPREYHLDYDENLAIELKKRGFNLIRLGLIWDSVEREPGKYNNEYLQKLADFAKCCEKHGIYVFLDMHQDLYSGFETGPGDGAPDWATLTDGNEYENPELIWGESYFMSAAVHSAFDNFWANTEFQGRGIMDRYIDMWKYAIGFFKDNTALFGFDLMNEPFPGSSGGTIFFNVINSLLKVASEQTGRQLQIMDLLGLFTGNAEAGDLLELFDNKELFKKVVNESFSYVEDFDLNSYSPFLNKAADGIREITDKGFIMMEHCYYSNLGIPCSVPNITLKDGTVEPNQVFAAHGYDFLVDTPMYDSASSNRAEVIFEETAETQKRLGIPVVIGEWGGCSSGPCNREHINFLLSFFDSHKWSNTYWAYFDGFFDTEICSMINRTYPVAITGNIESYGFDTANSIYKLSFSQELETDEESILYLDKKPLKIELSDGEYRLEDIEDSEGKMMYLKTDKGYNSLIISF